MLKVNPDWDNSYQEYVSLHTEHDSRETVGWVFSMPSLFEFFQDLFHSDLC